MGIPAEALLPFIFGSSGGGGGGGDSTYIPTFGSLASISTGTSWSGDNPYTSTVTVTGYTVTNKTMVNVLLSSDVVEQMIEDGTTNIFITNNSGTLTATAIGAAPTAAMTLQVLCTESDVSEDIAGLPAIVGDGIFDTLEANNLTDAVNQLSRQLSDKQDAPSTAGTAGQVLALDDNLNPVWANQSGGGGGTTDYAQLSNKPKINNVELDGNKTAHDLGLAAQSDIPTVPVQSVNGKTGAVVLSATDVGAKPDSYTAPVSSVNNKTGAVSLASGDIAYDESATYQDGSVGAELQNQTRQISDVEENQIPELKNAISQKQDAPSSAGTAGQVLGLDSNLNPAWVDQTGGSGGGMNIVNLSGTQITQVGADNTFYVCGELTELTFTAPAVGITMIRFTSGTTPTVCTINGVTSWMYGFDPTTDIEASKTYDINVLNGIGVAGWA